MEKNLAYFLNSSKSLDINKDFKKTIKIAILSSFTITGITEIIRVKCAETEINCITYLSPYNQYSQQILDTNSDLYKFNPDITFLILDNRSILRELFYNPYTISKNERKKIIEGKIKEINKLVEIFSEKNDSIICTSNLQVPSYSPYGINENKVEFGLKDMIREFNFKIKENTKNNSKQFILDFDSFITKYGEDNVFDYKQYFLGDIKISFPFLPLIVDEMLCFVKPFLGKNKKCIVLDLDNTLWGGIVGEDGITGIKLDSTPPGNVFMEFQKELLALHDRGIILAINSKNNFDDAIKVIREHPNMILKENHFAAVRINWNDKVSNMKEIAKEINIGLDSIVFFDDDITNREMIRKMIPEVLTVEMSNDPSEYIKILKETKDFDIFKITKEDVGRGQMYYEQKKRNELSKEKTNLEDFFQELEIKIYINEANEFSIPRISQLILKTNQFNVTTKRYQEDEIREMSNNQKKKIYSVQVKDRFGDSGITGVVIIEKEPKEWIIDSFLLSCRVMGKEIENAVMEFLLCEAKKQGISFVKGKFLSTAKNQPAKTLFEKNGFKNNGIFWVFDLKDRIKTTKHILINENNV
jgi:FkbH-like protein